MCNQRRRKMKPPRVGVYSQARKFANLRVGKMDGAQVSLQTFIRRRALVDVEVAAAVDWAADQSHRGENVDLYMCMARVDARFSIANLQHWPRYKIPVGAVRRMYLTVLALLNDSVLRVGDALVVWAQWQSLDLEPDWATVELLEFAQHPHHAAEVWEHRLYTGASSSIVGRARQRTTFSVTSNILSLHTQCRSFCVDTLCVQCRDLQFAADNSAERCERHRAGDWMQRYAREMIARDSDCLLECSRVCETGSILSPCVTRIRRQMMEHALRVLANRGATPADDRRFPFWEICPPEEKLPGVPASIAEVESYAGLEAVEHGERHARILRMPDATSRQYCWTTYQNASEKEKYYVLLTVGALSRTGRAFRHIIRREALSSRIDERFKEMADGDASFSPEFNLYKLAPSAAWAMSLAVCRVGDALDGQGCPKYSIATHVERLLGQIEYRNCYSRVRRTLLAIGAWRLMMNLQRGTCSQESVASLVSAMLREANKILASLATLCRAIIYLRADSPPARSSRADANYTMYFHRGMACLWELLPLVRHQAESSELGRRQVDRLRATFELITAGIGGRTEYFTTEWIDRWNAWIDNGTWTR